MYEENLSPLLAQVPLTVSPFVSLPTATSLPYTYKSLPTSLPPSSTGQGASDGAKPQYVVSASGRAAHPDEVVASCQALQKHLRELPADAERTLGKWEASVAERDLAERRRVAPGWLDRNEKILEPSKTAVASVDPEATADESKAEENEIDRAFGLVSLK